MHAFLLDAVVDPAYRRRGVGRRLVRMLAEQAASCECVRLHVDDEPRLERFHADSCRLSPTRAWLLRLEAGPAADGAGRPGGPRVR